MNIVENNAAMFTVGDVVNTVLGTSFNFDNSGSGAQYTFTFEVD